MSEQRDQPQPYEDLPRDALLKLVEALLQQNQWLAKVSHTDALTGIPSLSMLIPVIQAMDEVACSTVTSGDVGQTGSTIYVIVLDLDNFKAFNDTYGHAMGDILLQAVAKVVDVGCRKQRQPAFQDHLAHLDRDDAGSIGVLELSCRKGGDEFIVTGFIQAEHEAAIIAQRLRSMITVVCWEFCRDRGLPIRVEVSVGVAARTYTPELVEQIRSGQLPSVPFFVPVVPGEGPISIPGVFARLFEDADRDMYAKKEARKRARRRRANRSRISRFVNLAVRWLTGRSECSIGSG